MTLTQKQYWDRAAATKEFTTPFRMDRFKPWVPETSAVLDVGCGYGRTLNELYQEGYRKIFGVDISRKMIERGKKQYPHLDMRECNAALFFTDNTFDAVLLIAVLTCIVEDETQEELIKEIERVLKPGGILYVNDFLINQDQRNTDRYNAFKEQYGTYGVFELEEGAVLRHHTENHLFHLTRRFETMAYKSLVYTTMNHHRSNGCFYVGKLRV